MGFRTKTKVDLTKQIEQAAKSLDGISVEVGVIRGEHQWLAGIHEYGCTIQVTPRMRAYLHRIGVHLKKSTTQIVIPERSFLRTGYDVNREDALRKAERLLPDALDGKLSAEQYFETVGTQVRDYIKDYAVELSEPPKKDWPTRDPAKTNPLVISGDMINGIEYEVKR